MGENEEEREEEREDGRRRESVKNRIQTQMKMYLYIEFCLFADGSADNLKGRAENVIRRRLCSVGRLLDGLRTDILHQTKGVGVERREIEKEREYE